MRSIRQREPPAKRRIPFPMAATKASLLGSRRDASSGKSGRTGLRTRSLPAKHSDAYVKAGEIATPASAIARCSPFSLGYQAEIAAADKRNADADGADAQGALFLALRKRSRPTLDLPLAMAARPACFATGRADSPTPSPNYDAAINTLKDPSTATWPTATATRAPPGNPSANPSGRSITRWPTCSFDKADAATNEQ